MKDHITLEGHDGAFAAYIARPKTLPTGVVAPFELQGDGRHLYPSCYSGEACGTDEVGENDSSAEQKAAEVPASEE